MTHSPPPLSSRQRTSAQCVTGSANRVGAAFVSAPGACSVWVLAFLALVVSVFVSDLALALALGFLAFGFLLRETPSTVHSSSGCGRRIPARSRDAALARGGTGVSATHVRASHPKPRTAETKSAAASSCVAARLERAKHSRSVGPVLERSCAASIASLRLASGSGRRRRRAVVVDDVAGFFATWRVSIGRPSSSDDSSRTMTPPASPLAPFDSPSMTPPPAPPRPGSNPGPRDPLRSGLYQVDVAREPLGHARDVVPRRRRLRRRFAANGEGDLSGHHRRGHRPRQRAGRRAVVRRRPRDRGTVSVFCACRPGPRARRRSCGEVSPFVSAFRALGFFPSSPPPPRRRLTRRRRIRTRPPRPRRRTR